ncbi:hypothetical protein Hbl1158_14695 [Halobaculum sp. CBA1158]|uniref:protein kinase domain-containing protein n=1 Tax=Halobaculum sp. CBA1158 TaxID=2904243 RepID=UPI001F47942B|nr:hypothetical protein [Halobaculum sp. CBA1158]UIO99749.1 hypothetical protein Hbl1158_14695 [Halobaculum sp. CBA1158]
MQLVDDPSFQTWLLGLPVGGAALSAAVGLVVPGVGPVLLGGAGLAVGACLSVAMVYLVSTDDSASDPGGSGLAGSAPDGRSSATGPGTAPVRIRVVDAVSGELVRDPVSVLAEQSVIGDRREFAVENGEATVELRTLGWDLTAAYDGRRATEAVAVGDDETVEIAIPPTRLHVAVADRSDDPLPTATVSCRAEPTVAAAGDAVAAERDDATHTVPLSATAERATIAVEHPEYASERTDVLLDGDGDHRATVRLERPATTGEPGGVDDVGAAAETTAADAEPATADAEQAGANAETATAPAAGTGDAGGDPGAAGGSAASADGRGDGGAGTPSASPATGTDRPSEGDGENESGGGAPGEGDGASGTDGDPAAGNDDPVVGNDDRADDPTDDPDDDAGSDGDPNVADGVEIERVGVTGIDHHLPSTSPDPPRIGLEPARVEAADEVIAENDHTARKRVVAGDRELVVTVPNGTKDGRRTVRTTAERADEWRDIDHHPHVAKLLAAEAGDRPYLAVERGDRTVESVAGESEQRTALWLAACVADAVATAHRSGVYHLDLEPGNVLLQDVERGSWPVAKVTGWDLPRLTDLPSDVFRPLATAHATPEQLDHEATVDERTDVYQLGVLTHYLLVGETPMNGGHAVDRTSASSAPIPAITDLDAELHGDLDAILRRATAVEPAARYGTADELREDLVDVAGRVAGFI